MPSRRTAVRVTAGVVILTVVPVVGTRVALGLINGRGTGTVTASSGTWAAVATTTGTPPYGPVTLTFTKTSTVQYLTILNTGTLDLTGVTTQITLSAKVTGSLTACSTSWNQATGLCPGTTTPLDTSTAGATTTAIPLPVGGQLSVKATAAAKSSMTMTVDVSVPRALARPATTTDS